ncbi:MAG TPA: NADH-quinone oxidoreductase subunit L [Ktedonobacteraceae bacterium]|nr:NADH-quinone oxidoreductase subunit L [Ktedonobacteraceae bacterium]
MTNLTVWVLLLPLLGFILLGLFGKGMPRSAILTIAWGASGLAFLFAAIGFLSMLRTPPGAARISDQVLYVWVNSGSVAAGVLHNNIPLNISFGLLLDPLSATMLMIVTGVGFLIHIYSAGYMEEDPGFGRFFAYLNFFIFAMVLLVSADNFLFLLVGWALVGLASFLLIGFWFTRRSAVAAARKALVINIIGDFGLMIAIFLIFQNYQTLNYLASSASNSLGVFNQVTAGGLSTTITTAICLLLFVACAAKSAQLPLYMWLPDAMEGPTPVSALIHAATMVTAGVYLVARANPLFEVSPAALITVAVIGTATALFAATIALAQLDIKRVLAYSTISQLGYMFMAEGAQNYGAGVFHLTTHAYFKALLFLGAGSVIHALGGEQDMRQMGGLRNHLKITYATFLIASLAISGIFPLAGFWSKDEIIGSLLAQATHGGGALFYVLWVLALVTTGLTAFYMFRLVFNIFFGDYRGSGPLTHGHGDEEAEEAEHHGGHGGLYAIYESPTIMTVPLLILAVLSVIGGLVGSFALFGRASWQPFADFLSPIFTNPAWTGAPVHDITLSIGMEWLSTGLSLGIALLGIAVAWLMYGRGFAYNESRNPLYRLVLHKYYIDELCEAVIINPLQWLGRTATSLFEGNLLDGGSRGVASIMRGSSDLLRRLQTGYMRNYALAILFGVVLLVIYYAVMKG